MVFEKMATICPDFKWLVGLPDFRFQIQIVCNPTSFGPFEIQTRSDFRSQLYLKRRLTCSNDTEANLVRLSPPFVTSRETSEHFWHVHRGWHMITWSSGGVPASGKSRSTSECSRMDLAPATSFSWMALNNFWSREEFGVSLACSGRRGIRDKPPDLMCSSARKERTLLNKSNAARI